MAITTTKARLNLSIDSELKQEVSEGLKTRLGLTILQQLIYISIKSDVIRKIHLNLKHEKFNCR